MKEYDPDEIAKDLCKRLPLQPPLPGLEKEARTTAWGIIYNVLSQFDVQGESRDEIYEEGYYAGYEAAESESPNCDFCDRIDEQYEKGFERGKEEGFEEGKNYWKQIPEEQKRMFNFNGTPNLNV